MAQGCGVVRCRPAVSAILLCCCRELPCCNSAQSSVAAKELLAVVVSRGWPAWLPTSRDVQYLRHRGSKQVFQHFSPADRLRYAKQADSQLALCKHQFVFLRRRCVHCSNQHFHCVLFIVLSSMQHCRLEGSRSLFPFATLILHWHHLPFSLAPHSLKHVPHLAVVTDIS